jgi:hypothetical protein
MIAERTGYAIVGIVPAYDRDMVSPAVVKRVYEALCQSAGGPRGARRAGRGVIHAQNARALEHAVPIELSLAMESLRMFARHVNRHSWAALVGLFVGVGVGAALVSPSRASAQIQGVRPEVHLDLALHGDPGVGARLDIPIMPEGLIDEHHR